uniref:Ankyrin repeat protein n=1 Tax=Strongyloides venezuelensis TaxID=75913 RepID=A0A0K0EXC3_STRVS
MMEKKLYEEMKIQNSLIQRKGSFKYFVSKSVNAQRKAIKRIMSFKQCKNINYQNEFTTTRNLEKLSNPRYSLKETYICSYIKEMDIQLIHHRGSAPEIMNKSFISKQRKVIESGKIFDEYHNHHFFAVFSSLIKPYMISVEKNQGGKEVVTVKPSITHVLATEVLAQKLERFEDFKNGSNCSIDSISGSHNSSLLSRQYDSQNAYNEKSRHSSPFRYVKSLKVSEPFNNIQQNILILIEAITAVEVDDVVTLNTLISNNDFDVNTSINSGLYREFRYKMGLLDIALMLGHYKCANLLLDKGATIKQDIDIINRRKIVNEVKKVYEEKILYLLGMDSDKNNEDQKVINHIIQQSNIIKKMEAVIRKNETTGHAVDARVYVSSSNTVLFEFFPPPTSIGNTIIKYKIEWSLSEEFDKIIDFKIIYDVRQNFAEIDNLIHGNSYYFRIAGGSIYGDGIPIIAHPYPITISSWEDVDNVIVGNEIESHQEAITSLSRNVEKFKNSIVWQRIFPTNIEGITKKKPSRLRYLFSASKKFVKNVQKGIYLTSIIYSTDKVLCTVDDGLPIIAVEENDLNMSKDDMKWLIKLSRCWEQLHILQDTNSIQSTNFQFRTSIIDSVNSMINALGIKNIGTVHYAPIMFEKKGIIFIVTVRFTFEGQLSQGLATKWTTLSKLIRKKTNCPAIDFLNNEVINILNFYESYQIPLDRGLYLCYLKTFSTLSSVNLLVPENLPNSLPFICVRDNPHVSKEEWEWIQMLNEIDLYEESDEINFSNNEKELLQDNESRENSDDKEVNKNSNNSCSQKILPTYTQRHFQKKIYRSIQMFFKDLGISSTKMMDHRLYRLRVFRLNPDVSMILIVPNIDEVCSMVTDNKGFIKNMELLKSCQTIPIPIFEMLHLSTYQPEFMNSFCQLSIFIEHYLTVTQYEYRKCIVDRDEKIYRELLDKLNEFKNQLEVIWRNARWVSNIATIARDSKKSNSFIDFSKIPIHSRSGKCQEYDLNSITKNNDYYSDLTSKKIVNNAIFNGMENECSSNSNIYLNNFSTKRKKKSFKTKSNAIFNFDKLFINDKKLNDTKLHVYRNCNIDRSKYISQLSKKNKKDELCLRIRSASQGSHFFKFRKKFSKSDTYISRKERLMRNDTASIVNDHEFNNRNDTLSKEIMGFGLLRVNIAFNYCQNVGASIRLRVTKNTTCKEVITLIVKQLNHVKAKVINETFPNTSEEEEKKEIRKTLYQEEDFCLVVILGGRERRLRNEFQPLNLGLPWNKGKLYIRHIDTPCEAIMCGNEILV